MNAPLSDSQIEEFNAIYGKGCELQKGLIILDGTPPRKLGYFQKRALRKSIQLLEEALKIYADSWQSMFFIGKATQALGDLEGALSWFIKVQAYEPDNPSIALEAGLCAGQLGKPELSVKLMEGCANAHPEDASLQCNIGLSYLMNNQISDARRAFANALSAEPNNQTNANLLRLTDAVAEGRIPCPKSENEILAHI